MTGRLPVGVSASGPAIINTVGKNDGRAVNNRNISHRHTYPRGQGESIGGTYGNHPSFDDTFDTLTTSGDTNNTDSPAYLVLSYIIKALD